MLIELPDNVTIGAELFDIMQYRRMELIYFSSNTLRKLWLTLLIIT
jgi:hypothetical protein